MSNRPVKKKVVEITEEDFDVEWTPPPRTGRDRLIQAGVFFLIICFLLPVVTCAVVPEQEQVDPAQQAIQNDPIEMEIKRYSEELAQKPDDPTVLANLGYYTTQKAAIKGMTGDNEEKMTLLNTSEGYLRKALEQDQDYTFALSELAKNLMMQEKYGEADELVEKALVQVEPQLEAEDAAEANEAKSRKVELLRISAVGEMEQGNNEAALEKMDQVIELKPGEPRLYMARAQFKMTSGNKEGAREDLTQAVDIAQKIGDMGSVQAGQQMLEALDSPPELEVVKVEETEVTPSPSATP